MTACQKKILTEILLVFALAMTAIWTSVDYKIICWVAAAVGFSIVGRTWWRERSAFCADVGLAVSRKDAGRIGSGLLWLMYALGAVIWIGFMITPGFWRDGQMIKKFSSFGIFYLISVILQELLLQGYFANRTYAAFPGRPRFAAFLVALLFTIVHFPNWLLASGTFVFAFGSSYFFLMRSRNLYLMVFAHLILSTVFKALVMNPGIGHGCMRIGPLFLIR